MHSNRPSLQPGGSGLELMERLSGQVKPMQDQLQFGLPWTKLNSLIKLNFGVVEPAEHPAKRDQRFGMIGRALDNQGKAGGGLPALVQGQKRPAQIDLGFDQARGPSDRLTELGFGLDRTAKAQQGRPPDCCWLRQGRDEAAGPFGRGI